MAIDRAKGSSGASPAAGSNGQIQYNNNGLLGASSNLTFDGSTLSVNGGLSLAGAVTNSALPAFLTYGSCTVQYTGSGQENTVNFTGGEIFDRGNDWNGTTTFTAPVTGLYQLDTEVCLNGADNLSGGGIKYAGVRIVTSNRTYSTWEFVQQVNVGHFTSLSILADMDASDTATIVSFGVNSDNAGLYTVSGIESQRFSGYLVA